MNDRRRPPSEVSPEYEDSGLFRSALAQWKAELVPQFAQNSRQDLIVKGFLDGSSAIEVVFAGRRREDVGPVVDLLKAMWTRANTKIPPGAEPPKHDDVRLPIVIDGSWRPRFQTDTQGWQTRDHQLYAARWHIQQTNGEWVTFGQAPRIMSAQTSG